ncbi:MAG: hypothetical protein ACE5JS_02630 [Nitrospinota bacterium]
MMAGSEAEEGAGGPTERVGRKRRKGRGRKKAKEFMDEAYTAYIRYSALQISREVEEIKSQEGSDEGRRKALETLARFEERERYAPIWQRHWAEVVGDLALSAGPHEAFQAIEKALGESFDEEEEARRKNGEPGLLEEGDGRRFLDLALGRLFEESEGEIEAL